MGFRLVSLVSVTDEQITFHLVDGRVISVPLVWSWRLSDVMPAQRSNYEIIGDGQGLHWPEVDEDLSVEGMLHGVPARRSKKKQSPREPDNAAAVRRAARVGTTKPEADLSRRSRLSVEPLCR